MASSGRTEWMFDATIESGRIVNVSVHKWPDGELGALFIAVNSGRDSHHLVMWIPLFRSSNADEDEVDRSAALVEKSTTQTTTPKPLTTKRTLLPTPITTAPLTPSMKRHREEITAEEDRKKQKLDFQSPTQDFRFLSPAQYYSSRVLDHAHILTIRTKKNMSLSLTTRLQLVEPVRMMIWIGAVDVTEVMCSNAQQYPQRLNSGRLTYTWALCSKRATSTLARRHHCQPYLNVAFIVNGERYYVWTQVICAVTRPHNDSVGQLSVGNIFMFFYESRN